ncbi:MAG: hypothetical protein JW940_24690 [Polyangiaceae bacterium]|nr:hypothetical protein [Polyangiaceae bacterium]
MHPGQLTARETAAIKAMVTSTQYRHMPTSTLAVYAQRVGKVFGELQYPHSSPRGRFLSCLLGSER